MGLLAGVAQAEDRILILEHNLHNLLCSHKVLSSLSQRLPVVLESSLVFTFSGALLAGVVELFYFYLFTL